MQTYAFGAFRLDLTRGELRENDREVSLEPRVFALLTYFVENAGRLLSRVELMEKLWPETHVTDASLSQAVAALRTALHDEAQTPRYIDTLPKRGYKFIAEVRADTPPGASYHIVYGLQDFVLAQGENIIGRAGDAAVRIRSDDVSRHHAKVTILSSGARIEDLGSRNGTIVCGERLERPRDLRDGDEIVLGDIKITFHVSQGTLSSATVPRTPRPGAE